MNTPTTPAAHPIWAMAFRPFYLLAALYGALSVLAWGAGYNSAFGYTGTAALPARFWHAHTSIWGYAGTLVVAFLLTAVATWTKQPPVRGRFLMVLTGLWLAARAGIYLPDPVYGGIAGTLFYWLSAWGMGVSVWKSRNTRNYIAVFALFMLGTSQAAFHWHLRSSGFAALDDGLFAGLMMVAGFIGLVGNRIISFFTSKKLNTVQVASPQWLMLSTMLLPLAAAVLLMTLTALPLAGVLAAAAGVVSCIQSVRWFEKGIVREPLLWVLHAGYASAALGLLVMGIAMFQPALRSLGVHLLAVGGIGLLTVGMITRTALGHTGRPLYPAPRFLPTAFLLMLAATLLRALAAVLLLAGSATGYTHSLRCSAVLFAASLLIYFVRYLPWLTRPRIDGKVG